MALEKETAVDLIEVLEDGTLQIREAIRVLEDGVVLSQSFYRHVLVPGQDVSSEPQKIQDIAAATWTQEVIDAYNAAHPAP